VFAKSVLEPIEDSGELDETKESRGEFTVTSAKTAMTFDPTPEVLDAVPSMIKPAAERTRAAALSAAWDAGGTADVPDARAQSVGIKAFVGNESASSQQAHVFLWQRDRGAVLFVHVACDVAP
jgi:hypothetical protein